ncbi:hypothetical protein ACRBU7_03950 [Priestia aryabhattai]|uniref:hypothetical protein n=1 Tax=Priestia aryabhattai TaxID=412384 RepID=UPI003D7FF752
MKKIEKVVNEFKNEIEIENLRCDRNKKIAKVLTTIIDNEFLKDYKAQFIEANSKLLFEYTNQYDETMEMKIGLQSDLGFYISFYDERIVFEDTCARSVVNYIEKLAVEFEDFPDF